MSGAASSAVHRACNIENSRRYQVLFPESFYYPNVARFVRGELPKVIDKPRIFNAFIEYGEFKSEKAAKTALTYGENPQLAVKELPVGKYGYYPGNGDEIQLNQTIAEQFEKTIAFSYQPYGRPADWDRLLRDVNRMLEAIILHEIVHWHDVKDGRTRDPIPEPGNDWGNKFENKAYGRSFSSTDIKDWMGWQYVKDNKKTYAIPYLYDDSNLPRSPPAPRHRYSVPMGLTSRPNKRWK